jgi:hypothetical protein
MPPRFAYWTIIAGGLPTAFRAAERDELLPTFRRIQEKHPDAVMKYFARGKLWSSPEEARAAAEMRRAARTRDEGRRAQATGRGRDWRPGGDHHDPRQKFKDAKKARNLSRRRQRFERRTRDEKLHDERDRQPDDASRRSAKRSLTTERFKRRQDPRSATGRPRPPKRNRNRS